MKGRLRVALVGAGLAAQSHALDIVTDGTMELAGVVGTRSPSAECLAGLFGGIVYESLDAMLEDRSVDGVVIAVPPRAVFEVLDRVAATGRPCLAEKPVATSGDSQRLLEGLAARKAPVIAPFNRRYQQHFSQARAVLTAGGIGEISHVEAMWQGPYSQRFGSGSGTYRASATAREGALLDSGSHALDAVSLLLGGLAGARVGPAEMRCNPLDAEVEGEASFSIGATAVALRLIDVPDAPACGGWRLQVRGTEGLLTVNEQGWAVEAHGGTRRAVPAGDEAARPVSDLHRLHRGDQALGTGLEEAIGLSGVITAIYDASSRTRAPWCRPRGKALGRLNGAC